MQTKHYIFTFLILISTCIQGNLHAQTVIQGLVKDSVTGETLPAVSLQVKGTTLGTATDNDGNYHLSLPASQSKSNTLVVSYLGYRTKEVPFTPGRTNKQNIALAPSTYELSEVIVKPKKEKYHKKGNPAVEFVQNVIARREQNDPHNHDFYSNEYYEKMTFALNDYEKKQAQKGLAKKFNFITEYVDTSEISGLPILNVSIKETLGSQYYRKSPHAEKTVIHGIKRAGVDEFLQQDGVQLFLNEVFQRINLFQNDIPLMLNRFVSPLSTIGPSYYKYYLMDTVVVEGEKCVDLGFVPFNSESLGFTGHLYVTLDSTYFVKRAKLNVPKDINLNFVEGMTIEQDYARTPDGTRLIDKDDVTVEFKVTSKSKGLHARRTVTYKNHSFDPPRDLAVFNKEEKVIEENNARARTDEYWTERRHMPIKQKENAVEAMLERLREVPIYYYTEKLVMILVSGYIPTAKVGSKVDIGPMNTSISANNVEGARLRMGGATTAYLNKRWFADGYVAYGTKDEKLKYLAGIEYSFKDKNEHPNEFTIHSLRAEYKYDVNQLGQHYLYTNMDNMFLSLKRKSDDRVTYIRQASLAYKREHYSGLSYGATLRYQTEYATSYVPFIQKLGDGTLRYHKDYNLSEAELFIRYAPNEKYYQTRNHRIPITFDAPIFTLTHRVAKKGFLGADYDYNFTEFGFQKRFWLSAFGYTDIILKAGKVWDKVPFLLLAIPNANLSYTIQYESYSLMNAMEFLNDQYASWDITYYPNGALFNRIPGLQKLKWREVFNFKGLYGNLTKKNNPAFTEGLFEFPEGSYTMTNRPYMEVSVGVENIFKFLAVNYVWRLSYLDNPDINKSGVRIALHFTF